MKEKLIELLGLAPEATDEHVVQVVGSLRQGYHKLERAYEQLAESKSSGKDQKREAKLAAMMRASGMTRENAELTLKHQAEADANRKGGK